MSGADRRDAGGFSLVDTIAMLTLVALVSAVAAPLANRWVEAARLRGAGWSLASDLQRARQKAITENRSHRLTVSDEELEAGLARVYRIAPAATGVPSERRQLPDGVVSLDGAGTWVEFNSRGLATGSAEFRLRGAGGGTITVRVRSTGQVDLVG